jgi:protein-disulfide isomerase
MLAQGQTAAGKSPPPRQQATSEQEELRREVRELKQGQEAIQKELQEIKRLLLAKAAAPARPAPPEKISIAARPFRGDENARIVLVEFSDYQCPFCGRFFRDALPQIDREYIKTGKIKYVFNHMPLEEIHPRALQAAQAAECAGEQGKFWELHDRMFGNQNALSPADLTSQAKAIGLDMPKFSQCLESGRTSAAIQASQEQAASMGIEGTPAFVIGLLDPKNPRDPNLKILGLIGGAQPYTVFKAALEKALGRPNP